MARRVSAVRPARRRWPWVLVLALLVVPTLEIAVILAVGRTMGVWPTVILLVLESALGAWLVKREGARTWGALAGAINTGVMPSHQLADAALVLVGGTLLLTPGFLTDLVGFVLILPVTRPLARRLLETVITRRLLGGLVTMRSAGRSPAAHDTVPGRVVDGPPTGVEGEEPTDGRSGGAARGGQAHG